MECDEDLFEASEKSYVSDDESLLKKSDPPIDNEVEPNTKVKQVKPRKVSKSVHSKLDPNRICGPRGIPAAATEFRNLRLQGKGHEKSDLDTLLSKMEHWAHRLFPKLSFDDCVEQVAKLGNNRTVQVHMKRFRSNEEMEEPEPEAKDTVDEDHANELFDRISKVSEITDISRSSMLDQSANSTAKSLVTSDQHSRMLENKRLAEEKRRSRLMGLPSQPLNCSEIIADCDIVQTPAASNENSSLTKPMFEEKISTSEDAESEVIDIDTFLENFD
nr:EOG090X0AVC [Megafenestra aurita]